MSLIPFSLRSKENIYLEYVNEWNTIKEMADNYLRSEDEMRSIILEGQKEYEAKTPIFLNPFLTT